MKKIRTVFFSVIMLFCLAASPLAFGQNLDLGALAAYDYRGATDARATCHLNVSQIGRDFSGRYFQDFRSWVDGRPDLNFDLRLKGADRYRAPDAIEGQTAFYNIPMDGVVLVVISNLSNPVQVLEYRLLDASGLSTAPIIRCLNVRSVPR